MCFNKDMNTAATATTHQAIVAYSTDELRALRIALAAKLAITANNKTATRIHKAITRVDWELMLRGEKRAW
jgi:hypothetical protein